jgi:hypothetical protein
VWRRRVRKERELGDGKQRENKPSCASSKTHPKKILILLE